MDSPRSYRSAGLGIGFLSLIAIVTFWQWRTGPPPALPPVAAATPSASAESKWTPAKQEPISEVVKGAANEPKSVAKAPLTLEQRKEVDRKNLRLLHTAIFAYKKAHGRFPEYLSQLAPEFVEASVLMSPERSEKATREVLLNHPDPGNEKPSYAFEFSNLVFRDGRTFSEIKEVQRAEWGDAVPLLRKFGYDKVINMSYGGDLYETALNWEWDPATLDVVAAKGWGPGLQEGEFTMVQVVGPSGSPLPNAQVWADGRNYSFDLPNRPFTTDARGFAKIPLGVDTDRTALVLRFEGDGLASPVVAFPRGQPPGDYVLTAAASRTVGGRVVNETGQPLANTWVYLNRFPDAAGGGSAAAIEVRLGTVKTDATGQWRAQLHPADVALFGIAVADGPVGSRNMLRQRVDPVKAVAGAAITTIKPYSMTKIGDR